MKKIKFYLKNLYIKVLLILMLTKEYVNLFFLIIKITENNLQIIDLMFVFYIRYLITFDPSQDL